MPDSSKYHGNSIVASIALVQLKYLDEDNVRRNELAQLYIGKLKNEEKVEIVNIAPGCSSSRHLFQIRVSDRDKIMQHFYSNQIYPGVHYIDNTHYSMYQYASGTCPKAHKASDEIISLPLHLNLTNEDVEEVVRVLKDGLSLL